MIEMCGYTQQGNSTAEKIHIVNIPLVVTLKLKHSPAVLPGSYNSLRMYIVKSSPLLLGERGEPQHFLACGMFLLMLKQLVSVSPSGSVSIWQGTFLYLLS